MWIFRAERDEPVWVGPAQPGKGLGSAPGLGGGPPGSPGKKKGHTSGGGGGGASAYRYYRLNITANNGDTSFTSVEDLYLCATAGGSQAATGGTPSASTEYSSSFDAAKAFDGIGTSQWFTASGSAVPSWLQYDLGAGNEVAVVEYTIAAYTGEAGRAPKDWELQGSVDGSTWVTLDSQAGVTDWELSGRPANQKTFSAGAGDGSGPA